MKEMNLEDKNRINKEINEEIKENFEKYDLEIKRDSLLFSGLNAILGKYQDELLEQKKKGKMTVSDLETIIKYISILITESTYAELAIGKVVIKQEENVNNIKEKVKYMTFKLEEWNEKFIDIYNEIAPLGFISIDICKPFFKDFDKIIYILDYEIPNALKILKKNVKMKKESEEIICSEINRICNTIHLLGDCLEKFINKEI